MHRHATLYHVSCSLFSLIPRHLICGVPEQIYLPNALIQGNSHPGLVSVGCAIRCIGPVSDV